MTSSSFRFAALAALTLIAPEMHAQNLFVNSSFEQGVLDANTTSNYLLPDSATAASWLTGWQVAEQSTLRIWHRDNSVTSGLNATNGAQYIYLNAANGVFQSASLTEGVSYRLTFDAGRTVTSTAGGIATVTVGVGSAAFTLTGFSSSIESAARAWTSYSYDFTAADTAAYTFLFTAVNKGIYLDNISLTVVASAVPEPSTYALIFGAGVLTLVVWRKKTR